MNARRFFLLFFLCAIIPVAAAKLSLSLGWFSAGATNKGKWLDNELQFIPALKKGDVHWTIAYVNIGPCAQSCEAAAALLHQLYAGLGRKQLGVQAMFISDDKTALGKIGNRFAAMNVIPLPIELNHVVESAPQTHVPLHHHFFIINQHGIALLRYPLDDAAPANVAADVRADLLRLYNYDRSRL